MLEKYDYLCDVCGIDKRWNQTAVETLFEVFSTIGVQSEVSEQKTDHESEAVKAKETRIGSQADKEEKPKVYRLPYYSAVKKDFSAICRLLGDGYAVRTSFYTGRNFSRLKPGQIYKSPGRGRIRHAVVIIGAGRRGLINYYHFLNSWGKKFCLRILRTGAIVCTPRLRLSRGARKIEKARGGFGLLRASDIRARPVTFLRHQDDKDYYKLLLLKNIVPLGKTKAGPPAGPEEASIIPYRRVPQPSNICFRKLGELIRQKMQEGTSLIDSPDQVLGSNEPHQQSAQSVHGICSHREKAARAAGGEKGVPEEAECGGA